MKKTIFGIFAAFICGFIVFSSCSRREGEYRSMAGTVWHTTFSITYRSARDLDDSIRRVMRQVELSLSPFDSASVVSAINRGEPVRADSLVTMVMEASRSVWEQSSGAFDPTVAPLVNLWGFGWKKADSIAPTPAQISEALEAVGMGSCNVAPDGSVIKKSEATKFDFSAITKGLGCDMVGRMLERNGCNDYMVEIGGEIAVNGVNRYGEPWHVMIDAPVASDSAVVHKRLTIVELSTGGIATSGNYRNFRRTADRGRIGHTIDPVTGYPRTTSTLSATVIAPNCMLADAYATACMAMTPDSALMMIERASGVEALIVVAGSDSTMKLLPTAGFPYSK